MYTCLGCAAQGEGRNGHTRVSAAAPTAKPLERESERANALYLLLDRAAILAWFEKHAFAATPRGETDPRFRSCIKPMSHIADWARYEHPTANVFRKHRKSLAFRIGANEEPSQLATMSLAAYLFRKQRKSLAFNRGDTVELSQLA